jgi:hypothetical protein
VAGLHAALEQALTRRPSVRLAFLEDGVWIDGELLEPAGASEDGLGRAIFRCGIREIHFLAGVQRQELDQFLEPLGRALQGALNPLDEDLSVLLWEAELPHVCYLLFEEPQEEPSDAAPVETLEPACQVDEYADSDLDVGAGDPAAALRPLSEAARLEIMAGYRREETETTGKFGRLQIELLRAESSPEQCGVLAGHLREHLDALLAAGAFRHLQRLWESLPQEAPSAPATEAFRRLRSWFTSPALTRRTLQAPFPGGADLPSAVRLLESAPAAYVPDLVELAHVADPAVPAELVAACHCSLARDPSAHSRCLRDPRPVVRRTALDVEVADVDGVLALRALLGEPDPNFRKLVVRALGRATRKERIAGLVQGLNDADASVRVEAAETLAERVGRPALESLLQVLISRGFEQRSEDEQTAVFRAAALTAPREILPILAEVAERNRFFMPVRHRRRAAVALRVLVELGDEAQDYLARRWCRRRRDLLRRAHLLRHGRGAQGRKAA